VCTLDEIRRLTGDLFAAEAAWLPRFHYSVSGKEMD
jgi:hypothetical protein